MQPEAIAIALIITAALLVAEHVALYDQPWHIDEPWNYAVGVATLAAGWIAWGLIADGPVRPIDAAISIVLISFGAGAAIVVCYWFRGRLELAKKNTAVVTKARALTQDLIDKGTGHAAGKSDVHDRSRNN